MEQYTREVSATATMQDDPTARTLLFQAFERTARWPKDFPGFSAVLLGHDEGTIYRGTVKVLPPRSVEVSLPDPAMQQWAQEQIASLVGHRVFRTFDQADGKYGLTLGPADAHPLGQLIYIHGDGMNSRYRVRDERIWQIQRTLPRVKFTITIADTTTTQGDKVLTTHFTVYFFAPDSGRLTQVESFADDYTEVAGVALPRSRQVAFAEDGDVRLRRLILDKHTLLGV